MATPNIVTQQDFIRHEQKIKIRIRLYQSLLCVFLLGLWEICSDLSIINSFIFSSPSRVVKSFCDMIIDKSLFFHISITLMETVVSFFFVIVISVSIAIILWWNTTLSKVFEPYLIILNSLPKSALAPILIVWLGNNMKTIIITAISVAVFGSILNIYTGFCGVDPDKLKLIKTLKGNRFDCLRLIILPSSVPIIISVMKVNIGLSLVGVVIGEFLAAKAGLGYLIIYGSQTFKMDWVIMSIVLLCIIAMGLYYLISMVEKKYSYQI